MAVETDQMKTNIRFLNDKNHYLVYYLNSHQNEFYR